MSHSDRKRRAWCREKAIVFLYQHTGSKHRTFSWVLDRIRRRWPASSRDVTFEMRLQSIWLRERKRTHDHG